MCTRALHALVSRTTWLKKIGVGQLISCGDWLRIRGFYLRCQGRLILYSFGFWQFCSTRKSAQQAAQMLVKDARFIINSQHRQRLAGKSVSKRCLCPEPHWIRVRRAKNWFYPREQYREQISALECIKRWWTLAWSTHADLMPKLYPWYPSTSQHKIDLPIVLSTTSISVVFPRYLCWKRTYRGISWSFSSSVIQFPYSGFKGQQTLFMIRN